MVIFHCYVSLPEGTYTYDDIFFVVCAKTQPRYTKYQETPQILEWLLRCGREATGKAGFSGGSGTRWANQEVMVGISTMFYSASTNTTITITI